LQGRKVYNENKNIVTKAKHLSLSKAFKKTVMAYRASHIKKFIDKVNEEAEEAARKVYEKHEAEFNRLVSNQVLEGQHLYVGMGTATITQKGRELPYDYAKNFLSVISNAVHYNELHVSLSIGDIDKS
jgi:CRISPR/Cas system CMR subunit Cmr6 (Cas7 group RAMP superfamily)